MKNKRVKKTIATISPLPVELLDEICSWVRIFFCWYYFLAFYSLPFLPVGPTTSKRSQPVYTLFSVASILQLRATSITFASQHWRLQYSITTATSPTEVVIPRRMRRQRFCKISDVWLYVVLSAWRSCKSIQSDWDCNAQAPQGRDSIVQESWTHSVRVGFITTSRCLYLLIFWQLYSGKPWPTMDPRSHFRVLTGSSPNGVGCMCYRLRKASPPNQFSLQPSKNMYRTFKVGIKPCPKIHRPACNSHFPMPQLDSLRSQLSRFNRETFSVHRCR